GVPAGHCAAVALVGLRRYQEAAGSLEKLAADELRDRRDLAASLYDQAAQAWVLANDNAGGVRDETAALELGPDNPDLLVGRGVILASTGKYQQAIDDFSKAHDLAGKRADILVYRAIAYRKLNNTALARADLDRALELQPRNADAYLQRGIIRMLAKDAAGAKSDWQRVLDVGAGTPAAATAAANLQQLVAAPAAKPTAPPSQSVPAPAQPAPALAQPTQPAPVQPALA